ncbi:uncharacterized protein FTJAE_12044 [Fusarium tjaetaba]|uniref:Uncharacterized protein n=1 Tax=Fusarium tjaetaba TaxID=1567544 RepID=A0A8H5QSQ0_9HYPO|nr:uncharacterized protein FTJAE_12044 [Fusarium tjaetaba]KAF5619161.1 hypothetical protein FTJAE_12044 [Fusarium tjaetaba]
MSTQVPSPKLKLATAALESLDGMSYIHVLHGFRVCYPIFWDIARDSFTEQDKVRGLQKALAKLQGFDYGAESSNGWSVDQKIWGVGLAIVVIEDILSSPDVAKAFHFAKMDVEDWMEHANLLEPNMDVSRYMRPMQDPLLRQEVLASHYHWLEFDLPEAPEHLQQFLPKLERDTSVEEPEEKETDSMEGTESGHVDEIADSFCNIKID